jgi:O-antigen ligase
MIFKLLLVYLLSLPFTKLYLWIFGQKVQISELFFLPLIIAWFMDLVKSRRWPSGAGISRAFVIFMAFCLLSLFNSINLPLSMAELLGSIYLFVMLVVVVDIVDSRKKLDIIVKFWVYFLAVILSLGFLGLFISIATGKTNALCWVYEGNFPYLNNIYRITSIFHNPLALANYLFISFGIILSEILLTKNKTYNKLLKILALFICLQILFTISRETLSLFICALLIYNYFHKKKNLKFKIIRAFSVAIILLIFLYVTIFLSIFYIRSLKIDDTSKSYNNEISASVNYAYFTRFGYKLAAFEMLRRRPFFGVGLKMYRSYLQKLNSENYFYKKNIVPLYEYSIENQYSAYIRINDPHNDVLQYFAETGILGGCALILFLITFLSIVIKNLIKIKDLDDYFKIRIFCFFAAFIGVLIESIDLDVFKIHFVWLLMALTLALIRIRKLQNS